MSLEQKDPLDPKGLIRESYRIENITEGECRSIFLDWALSQQDDTHACIKALLERYLLTETDHPMTKVLTEGLEQASAPRRRGGRKARLDK